MSSSEQLPKIGAGAWLHFAGVAGSGMSALAQYHAQQGGLTTGSDRAFDQNERAEIRACLENLAVELLPQDGSFLRFNRGDFAGRQPDAVVVSTAVEDKVPDVKAARDSGVAILHRSELLARYVADHRTIAVSGTSGKSTVTAMVFAILQAACKGPGLLTGGALASLVADGHLGNAWGPTAQPDGPPWLVIEADESDGSLVRYHPWAGVVLNLGLDHKSPAEIMTMFTTFRQNVKGPLVVADEPNLASLHPGSLLFGLGTGPGTRALNVELLPDGSRFTIDGVEFQLKVPGAYNVLNATAAVAVCLAAGLTAAQTAAPLAEFTGVARRFQSVGSHNGIEVIDDFAHNPDKIAAALAAAQTRTRGRILAVFQPHGYGPTRFLREALVETFATELRPEDVLWMPEIFFAGGTVTRDISAGDLIGEIQQRGRDARFLAARNSLPAAMAAEAKTGDLVLVMGARDPSLTDFCRSILAALG
ncbi:MAG: cyanophycin synthetase [Candidatus Krumholzibacteria bacterium]|nr:cyanophycin synthetase [Candidatus Krumholzibacteria bacterium]